MKKELIVDINESKRIDAYISEKTEYSRATVQRLIDDEKIIINGKKKKLHIKSKKGIK